MWILFILLVITLIPIGFRWQKQRPLKRWYKTLNLHKHHSHFQALYKAMDGFSLSRQARSTKDAIEYTYGEIEFISFIALITLTHPHQKTVFYDLGSGTGKAVLATAMVFEVKKSCGIELFTPLHLAATQQKERLLQQKDYQTKASTIDLIHGNYFEVDFSDATLVFISATALFGETWAALNQQLLQVARGTIVITTSKKLSPPSFALKQTTLVNMSWGTVRAFIQERV